jgi:hypothetical protein
VIKSHLFFHLFLQFIPHGGERFTRQGRHRPPERCPGMRLDFAEENPAPRQNIVSKQRFQRFAFIFRSMIFKPGGGQQQ